MAEDEWSVTMPKLGETVTEGTVGNWLKQVGDDVAFDDPLFEVSTDKVDSEIPSPYDGVIAGDPRAGGGDGAGRHPAGADRRARVDAGAPDGGPASSDPAAPADGRLRGHARPPPPRGPACPVAGRGSSCGGRRRGARHHHAQARRDRHRGHGRQLAQARRRRRRVRRPAVRGVHRQGRLGDPQPVRRGAAGDPRAGGGDGAGRHAARPHRRAGRGAAGGRRGERPRPHRRRHPRPPRPLLRRHAAPAAAAANGGGTPLSPLVRRLAAENNLDLAKVPGTRRRRADPPRGRREGDRERRRHGDRGPAAAGRAGGRRAGDHRSRARPRPRRPRRRRRPAATRATRCSRSPGCGWRSPAG